MAVQNKFLDELFEGVRSPVLIRNNSSCDITVKFWLCTCIFRRKPGFSEFEMQ